MAATSASSSPRGKEKDRGNIHSMMVAIGTITDIRYSSDDVDDDEAVDNDGVILGIEVITDDIKFVVVANFFIQATTRTVTTNTIAT